jgi:hypothetical protein
MALDDEQLKWLRDGGVMVQLRNGRIIMMRLCPPHRKLELIPVMVPAAGDEASGGTGKNQREVDPQDGPERNASGFRAKCFGGASSFCHAG